MRDLTSRETASLMIALGTVTVVTAVGSWSRLHEPQTVVTIRRGQASQSGTSSSDPVARAVLGVRSSGAANRSVPPPPIAPVPGPTPGGKSAKLQPGSTVKIPVNTATASALMELPGVGPVMAGRIMSWRRTHGAFRSLQELRHIKGIGPKRLKRIAPFVTIP
ncbi:MAG: helix-hairpin-helix domain-containing protein [Armatimonadetes bacterium]|nr:helix-hairpin-helix domain-containing protein [Armatimonadota bacterium]MDE2207942.1 helix-hairpin-helix domain-containing protein [Armatimonadota bacterium]